MNTVGGFVLRLYLARSVFELRHFLLMIRFELKIF